MDRDKDVLLGWLVGKAGADFSLARALAEAASATVIAQAEEILAQPVHKSDQFNLSAPGGVTADTNEIDALRADMQLLRDRLNWLESALARAGQGEEALRRGLAGLQAQLDGTRRQEEIVRRLAEGMVAQFQALRLHETAGLAPESVSAERNTVTLQDLQTQLLNERKSVDTIIEDCKQAVNARMQTLEEQVQRKLASVIDRVAIAHKLDDEVQSLSRKLVTFESTYPRLEALVVRQDHHWDQLRRLEDKLDGRIRESANQQAFWLDALQQRDQVLNTEVSGPLKALKSEVAAFASRLTSSESALEQVQILAAAETRRSNLVAQLQDSLTALKVTAQEDATRLKQDIESAQAGLETRLITQIREVAIHEFSPRLALVEDRLQRMEAAATLQAPLAERLQQFERRQDAMDKTEFELSSKLRELEDNVSRAASLMKPSEGDVGRLQTEIKAHHRSLTKLRSVPSAMEVSGGAATGSVENAITPNHSTFSEKTGPTSDNSSESHSQTHGTPMTLHRADQNVISTGSSGIEDFRQLQERVSQELERVHVQLKSRTGRWKVRRHASSL